MGTTLIKWQNPNTEAIFLANEENWSDTGIRHAYIIVLLLDITADQDI